MPSYSSLQGEPENGAEPVEGHTVFLAQEENTPFRRLSKTAPIWVPFVLIPLFSLSLLGLGVWIGSNFFNHSAVCLEYIQQWCKCPSPNQAGMSNITPAPILQEVDNSLHIVRFNGSFLKENVFRGEAGPEVDTAWESLGVNCRLFTALSSSQTSTYTVKIGA
jgi:hypothetical protein